MLHITFLALRILRCLVHFWKMCAFLWSSPFFYPAFFLALFPSCFCPFFLSLFLPVFRILFKTVKCYSTGDSNMPACYLIILTPKTFLDLHGLIVRLVVNDDFAAKKNYHKDDEFVPMKNCLTWYELCGKEGKLEINFIPARTRQKCIIFSSKFSNLYITYIMCNKCSISCSSAVKIFLCRYYIFAECVTIL